MMVIQARVRQAIGMSGNMARKEMGDSVSVEYKAMI